MPLEDKQVRRRVEREVGKFPLDTARMNIRCLDSIAYFEGRVRLLKGSPAARGADLDKVLNTISDVVRRVPGIRDVSMFNLMRDY